METDDERFRAVYAQVVRLWKTMDDGTQDDIDAETDRLRELLELREGQHGA